MTATVNPNPLMPAPGLKNVALSAPNLGGFSSSAMPTNPYADLPDFKIRTAASHSPSPPPPSQPVPQADPRLAKMEAEMAELKSLLLSVSGALKGTSAPTPPPPSEPVVQRVPSVPSPVGPETPPPTEIDDIAYDEYEAEEDREVREMSDEVPAPHAILAGLTPFEQDLLKTLAKDVEQRDLWKLFRDGATKSGLVKWDKWPDRMLAEVQNRFWDIMRLQTFQVDVVRLCYHWEGKATLEKRVATTAAMMAGFEALTVFAGSLVGPIH